MYSSLLVRLQTKKLWPRKHAKDIHLSFTELTSVIKGLNVGSHPDVPLASTNVIYRHSLCKNKLELDKEIERVEKAICVIDPVLDCHKRHMANRRKMQGLLS